MAAEHQNFEVHAGSTLPVNFPLTWEDGDPYDLSTSEILWVIAVKAGAEPLVTKTIGYGIGVVHAVGEVSDPAVFQVTLDPDDTEELEGLYYHEARVDGMPVASGILTVLPSSTRVFGS